MKGVPRLRIQTYKDNRQAMRSFYKYVCKEGYFTKLENGVRTALRNPWNPYIWFESGYPLYDASRSRVRSYWERDGDARLDLVYKGIEEKQWVEICRRTEERRLEELEEFRKNRKVLKELKGSTFKSWFYVLINAGEDGNGMPREFIESLAFLTAIKQHIKNRPHEQHHRTTKRTLQPVPVPESRRRNRQGGNRNDQRCRKSPQLH